MARHSVNQASVMAPTAMVGPRQLAIDGLVVAAYLVTLGLFFEQRSLCLAVGVGLSILRFALSRSTRDLGIYAVGFFLGSIAEIVQVWAGAYTYRLPEPLVIPLCNFPLWGLVLLASKSVIERITSGRHQATLQVVALESALYATITTALCLGADSPRAVAALFAGVLLTRLLFFRAPHDLALAGIGVLIGPLAEAWLVSQKIYAFAHPAIIGLPLWHPIYWALIVLFLRRLFALV